jgi:uncharacterized protein YkwD
MDKIAVLFEKAHLTKEGERQMRNPTTTVITATLLSLMATFTAAQNEVSHAEFVESTPKLLARFGKHTSTPQTLFLYSSEPLTAVHTLVRNSWIAAKKERDASDEEPYYVYRLSPRYSPHDGQKILINSWSASGEVTFRHQLEFKQSQDDYRVTVDLRNVRTQEQYLADKASRPQLASYHEPVRSLVTAESQALINAVQETGARSVSGHCDPNLTRIAMRYARKMARQQRQDGHAGWGQRSQNLMGRYGSSGRPASEITAESWSHLGPSLDRHARSCVESWQQSPGHRADMMRYHGRYGYAMAQGNNGIYYAVGIFAN